MDLPEAPKFLIARGDVLGDVVMVTPLIRELKRCFPQSELTFLVSKDYIPILEDIPQVDGIIVDSLVHDDASGLLSGFDTLVDILRGNAFDVFIGAWELAVYGRLAKKAGIPIRIGHGTSLANRFNYTHIVKLDYLDFRLHKADYNLSLLGPIYPNYNRSATVYLHGNDAVFLDLQRRFPALNKPYMALHVDAGNPIRMLLPHQFVALVARLRESGVDNIVLFGRSRTLDVASAIMSHFGKTQGLVSLVGQLNLKETVQVIAYARAQISSDSGPVHIASGFQVPTAVYYFNRIQTAFHWGAWQSPHIIVQSDHPCIDVCRPTECQKTDCRLPFDTLALADAAYRLWGGERPHAQQQRQHWMETTLRLALFGPKQDLALQFFENRGIKAFAAGEGLSLRQQKTFICDHNINVLLYCGRAFPWTLFRLNIVRRWAANFITLFPKLWVGDSPEDWIQKLDAI